MTQADIGLVGLAVMGENLVLNIANHGYNVVVHNRTPSRVEKFLSDRARGKSITGAHSLNQLVSQLTPPRRIMLMVQAGNAVDKVVDSLVPLLQEGDIIIDGGNSHYKDTQRRTRNLADRNILFVGTGVSGGEEGALKGPSIMPGGNPQAWPHVQDIFQSIAAKVEDGSPCCDWIGGDGAGHYVKMVHNGIEYGDMQMIGEAYSLLRDVLGMEPAVQSTVFSEWNQGELNSYLVEITAEILAQIDGDTGQAMVDVILDTAGQKGTGKWTSREALDLGMPAATIAEAVFARFMSALKDERVAAASILEGPQSQFVGDTQTFVEDVRQSLYASKICSYAQGFQLLSMAAKENNWRLDYGSIASLWRGGCIIRAQFLGRIKESFDRDAQLGNLLLSPYFTEAIARAQTSWRRVVATDANLGIPVPAFSSSLCYYDSYRNAHLPANLVQAQRDYFGAHTYERVDRPRGNFFHTNWTGQGGPTASTTYNA